METIPAPSVPIVTSTASTTGKKLWELAEEEEVDKYWEQKDGKIERKKGTDLCQCGPKAMCDYCMPYEVCTDFSTSKLRTLTSK